MSHWDHVLMVPTWEDRRAILIDRFDAASSWTVTAGSAADSADYTKLGSTSVRMESDQSAVRVSASKSVPRFDVRQAGVFGLWVYVPRYREGSTMNPYLVSARLTLHAGAESAYLDNSQLFQNYGWNLCLYLWDESTWTLSAGWDSSVLVDSVSVSFEKQGEVATRVVAGYMDSLYRNVHSRPKCILSSDDGRATVHSVLMPMLATYGWRGTCYLTTSWVDTAGNMTAAELAEVYAAGWDIGNHSMTHSNLTTLTEAEALAEIEGARDWLITNGYTRRSCHLHLAYPYNARNSTVQLAAENAGCLTARAGTATSQPNALSGLYRLPSYDLDNLTIETLYAAVDAAIQSNACCHIFGHDAIGGSLTKWQQITAYLDSKRGQIDVVPFTEWYEWASRQTI
jgi:peptidoglycan/xylan/chitin deacetylase (PgdA/CDA1 family)